MVTLLALSCADPAVKYWFGLFIIIAASVGVNGQSLPEGLYCGRDNCYDLLEVARDSSKAEISKAYRLLAKKWHPDMHRNEKDKEKAAEMFLKIATAYETLRDDDAKKDYDYMLEHPDEYYFNYYKYYRRQMAPKVDVRIVIAVTISIVSVIQYLSAWKNYHTAIDILATVPRYQNQAREIAKKEGLLDDKKRKDKAKTKEELRQEEAAIIKAIIQEKLDLRGGYQKPSVLNILWFQLILLPYRIAVNVVWYIKWWFKYSVRRCEYDDDSKQYLIRRNLGWSQGQWESAEDHIREDFMNRELWKKDVFKEWKAEKDAEQKAKLAENTKEKMYRRRMKKGGPGQMMFGPE